METIQPLRFLRRVYCAGPLFNAAERNEMERIAQALRAHRFEPFLPHEEVQFATVHPHLVAHGLTDAEAGALLHRAIFALDVYQVVLGCGSLVMNLNGRVPDEGAVAESTMAWMLGKPVVFYKADSRSLIRGRDNPILAGQTAFHYVDRFEAIGPALEAAIGSGPMDPETSVPCPERLRQTLESGADLALRLEALGPDRPAEPTARLVLDRFRRPADGNG